MKRERLIADAFAIQPLALSRLQEPMGIGFRCARSFEGVRRVWDGKFDRSFVRGTLRFGWLRGRSGLVARLDSV